MPLLITPMLLAAKCLVVFVNTRKQKIPWFVWYCHACADSVGGQAAVGSLLVRQSQRARVAAAGVDGGAVWGDPATRHVGALHAGAAHDRGLHDVSGQHTLAAPARVVRRARYVQHVSSCHDRAYSRHTFLCQMFYRFYCVYDIYFPQWRVRLSVILACCLLLE